MSTVPHECSISKQKASVELEKELHSIPCKLDYTGPANVKGYFLREPLVEGVEKAAFRGHGLEGARLTLPAEYEVSVIKERNSAGSRRVFDVVGRSDGFQQWEWDREAGQRTIPARALALLNVASALADP